jgi:hypothetical protein
MALAAGLMAGCRSFEKDWSEARRGALSPDPRGLSGAWTGTWQNTNNTHGGPLRAVLWRVEDGKYRARFHAVWSHRSGSFSTTLRGGWTNDVFVFEGRRRILGVPIRTDGRATPTNLDSGYDSPLDRGTFTLRRRASD